MRLYVSTCMATNDQLTPQGSVSTPQGFDPVRFGEVCPRYEHCNAAFCPALGGSHLHGEPVCLYLREAVKPGGEARVRARIPKELAEVVLTHAARLMGTPGALAWALRTASQHGSQIETGDRLAALMKVRETA